MYVNDLYEGIRHIEDIPLKQFITALTFLEDYNITEKIDGSHIRVHLDEDGKLCMSRSGKNDNARYYSVDEFPNEPKYSFQRAALVCMERIEYDLRECGFESGDSIDLEVMMTHQPNAIKYDGNDRIIFLKKTGNVDLSKLRERLEERTITCNDIPAFAPQPNLELHVTNESRVFSFDTVPEIAGSMLTESSEWEEFTNKLNALRAYIKEPSGIASMSKGSVHEMNLNKRPSQIKPNAWKRVRTLAKPIRAHIRAQVMEHKREIKSLLINQFIANRTSKYNVGIEGGWLEGVVCEHKKTGATFKIVDRETFTEVNKFYYQVRKELTETPHNTEDVTSFLGAFQVRYGSSLGNGDLGTRKSAKILRGHGLTESSSVEQYYRASSNMVDDIGESNFRGLQSYLLEYIDQTREALYKKYHEYLAEKGQMVLEVNNVNHGYDGEVNRRTKITFCEVNETLYGYFKAVSEATCMEDLMMPLLLSRKL